MSQEISHDLGWILSRLCAALTTCLKMSPSLPLIDGSPLKELVMTSRGRKLCSLASYGV